MQRIISNGGRSVDKVLGDLYEDVHWILLISGNILTLVSFFAPTSRPAIVGPDRACKIAGSGWARA
jgi:hypothetical protein